MARFPVYTQQTKPQPSAMTPQAAGAGVGQAMSQVSDTLSTIGANIQQRDDVIERVRLLNQFDQDSITRLEEMRTTGDITSKDTVTQYFTDLHERKNQLVSEFRGSTAGREALRAQLENQAGQYHKSALTTQISAQHKLLADTTTNIANTLATQAATAPGQLDNLLYQLDGQIDSLAPALYPDQEREYRMTGKSTILTGAINSLLEKGQYSAAKQIMDSEEYNQFLSPDASRKFSVDIAVGEAEAAAANEVINKRIAEYSMLTKRELTPEEIARIKLLPSKPSEYTAGDKISEYELITGKPASQSVVDDIFNITAAGGGMYGNSLEGRMMKIVNEGALRYSSGLMTGVEAQEFQMAVNQLYAPKERTDQATGNVYTTQPTMPSFVRESLNRGSSIYGEVNVGGNAPGNVATQPQPVQDVPNQGESLWDLAGFIPGPVAAAARTGFSTPMSGGLGINPNYQKAAQRALNLREDIVAGIKPEGRIADQYRQELQSLVTIEPKIWDNETALRNRMVEIDGDLRKKLAELRKVSDGEVPSSVQERRDAFALSNNISRALGGMGIVHIKSREDALKLPPNTWFVNPNGELLKVPATQGK